MATFYSHHILVFKYVVKRYRRKHQEEVRRALVPYIVILGDSNFQDLQIMGIFKKIGEVLC